MHLDIYTVSRNAPRRYEKRTSVQGFLEPPSVNINIDLCLTDVSASAWANY